MFVWFLLLCKIRCGTGVRLHHYLVASVLRVSTSFVLNGRVGGPGRSGSGAFPREKTFRGR